MEVNDFILNYKLDPSTVLEDVYEIDPLVCVYMCIFSSYFTSQVYL